MNDSLAEIKGFIKGLFWGILVAIGLLIFLETERGQKLKKQLKDKGGDWLDCLPDLIDRIEEKGEELVKEAGKIEKELKDKKEEANTSLAHIENLQEHGREITSKIKSRLFRNLPKKPRASTMN